MSDDAERFFELRDEVDSQAKMFADASRGLFPPPSPMRQAW